MTTAQVAHVLGHSVPWVTSRVGSLFHPDRRGRVLYYKREDVEAVKKKLGQTSEAKEEDALAEHFERHAESPSAYPLERLMAITGVEPQEIKRLHSRWVNTRRLQGFSIPNIRTRAEIQKASEVATAAMHKHYDAEVAAIDKKTARKRHKFFDLDLTPSPERVKRCEAREARIEAMHKRLMGG